MKRKALDQQLELMVGQADKLSEMVQEGLAAEKLPDGSSEGENAEDGPLSGDADFGDIESESDDETTIAKAEEIDEEEEPNVAEELADLERQNNLELDDLLSSLPAGYLESMGLSRPGTSEETDRFNGSSMETQGSVLNLQDVKELGKTVDTKNEVDVDQAERSDLTTRSSSAISTKDEEDSRAVSDRSDQSKDVMSRINFGRLNSESSEDRQKELANIAEEALKLQPKGFTLETTQVKTQVPSLLRGALREYQMVGLDWLVTLYKKGLNGILADEMGLGKTIQTIALLAHLACDESNWGPHLIVVPTSVILNWEIEVKKWCPAFKILTYFGSQKERAEKRRGWSKTNAFHVCITSYKIVTQDIRAFKQKAWQYFILDEAQNIKNFKSQRWQTLLNIRARRRLLLTGTPLQNSLMELWSLMHFLMPTIFASHNDFKDWFSNPLTDMMEGNAEYNSQLVHRLHKVLRPFILRRLKSEVEKQLPEKTEHIIKCSLSKRQRYLYDDFMSRRSTRDNLRSGSVMSVLNIVMQLRKCCNHPNLFEPRPIVSPLSMRPVSVVYPAFLFNAVNREHDTGLPDIPECLQISRGFRGSAIVWSESRGLMLSAVEVEKRSYSSPPMPIPAVDGFKFVRPPPAKIFRQSSHHDLVSSPRSSSLNLPFTAAGLPLFAY
ncbi:hypothetical protein AB6A40_010338 [Gnathostoma spinigerum]|uniref:Helicase ATP-binding domain-containing protein n=1 Tax=Gnathostoma spinigerum TaxID=75299 RepID=A0ABD6F1C3_9BILA